MTAEEEIGDEDELLAEFERVGQRIAEGERDPAPGDMIRCASPSGAARVIKAYPSRKTMIGEKGRAPVKGDPTAWIVEFEIMDGLGKGRVDYTFQHPNDKVQGA